ncbi:heme-binding protein [Sandarakinorhabdus sp. DWP1-3-1]|uniref:heme-binding protein n=1 Tax=Sandarakinorhabdus sp. DWP1-3-1 TaxID=2804627 RepID=UPI003CF7D67B
MIPRAATLGLVLLLVGCGGGGTPAGGSSGGSPGGTPSTPAQPASVFARPAAEALTTADVETVIARAVAEARARNRPGVIAVVDRVGNVLAVFSMTGAPATAKLRPGSQGNTDLQGVTVPAALAAISKALTGAYLSSGGNAFSTRTASMIVQQHFPPSANSIGLESGPLSGVQFSQLPCSDLNTRVGTGAPMIGPKRAPLGLAADPGGFPLYRNGAVIGGVGIMADGDYGFDPEVVDIDRDDEEAIAIAASTGFEAPEAIRANRISVDGTTLRYADIDAAALKSVPASAPGYATISGSAGTLAPVAGFFAGSIVAGSAYGSEASGIRPASGTTEFNHPDAFVLSDGAGNNRFPVRAGTDAAEAGTPLSATEVRTLLEEAFKIMARARAQIRRPLDSRAQVSISVVDTRGAALGIVRSPDAPVFGIDVALQKARSVAFFSGRFAASDLAAATRADGSPDANVRDFGPRITAFTGSGDLLSGRIAVSNRAIGNLARPYFPDGEVARPNGPLSRPISQFSAFSTGLQSALVTPSLVQVLGGGNPARCTFIAATPDGGNRLANGLQIFPGGVPVYRGSTLVGAVGVSGDGIDQDDMIAFLGTANAGIRIGGIGLPPASIRSDQVIVPLAGTAGVRLRFVGCPFAPFVDTAEQNACQGL